MLPSSRSRTFLSTTTSAFLLAVSLSPSSSPPLCLAQFIQKNITNTPGFKLLPGITSVPAPISVAPDQEWMGIDGSWNTFSLQVGQPTENIHAYVSTASQQIWAVNSQACVQNVTDAGGKIVQYNVVNADCQGSRGRTFNTSFSTTWQRKGFYQLWIEKTLGLVGNGLYGFDSVGLGLPGEQGPTVANTTIGTLVSANFWLGHIGVHPKPTNFSAFEAPIPSYMTDLFTQKSIPSLSFGYTAGAQYRKTILVARTS